jgi:hypothetical protein
MPIENITNQCQVDIKVDMARLVRDAFIVADQICKQAHNIGMDELRVVSQEPEPMVLIGHEQWMSHVEGASPTSGSLPVFNNTYDMVDVKNDMMRVDVVRDNEEEAITGMPDMGGTMRDGAKSIWPLRRPQEYHCLKGQHCEAFQQHSSL